MTDIDKKKYLEEAIRIAGLLLKESFSDSNGIYWKSLQFTNDYQVELNISETVYSGNAGILLFFVELYKHTNSKDFQTIIERSANWLVHRCSNIPSDNPNFYTGRLGVAYVLLQVYRLFGDERLFLEIERISFKSIKAKEPLNGDLLSGSAGTLVGLIHLFDYYRKEWMLDEIDKHIGYLIKNAFFSLSDGISWNRNISMIKNLCGFSHGASGISFSLNETANYFNNHSLNWLARQAVIYENNQFDHHFGSWPDYRKDIRKPSMLNDVAKYDKGDVKDLVTAGHYDFWCHGAGGIGISRIRAFKLLNSVDDLNDVHKCIEILRRKNLTANFLDTSFSLCHGFGGDAIFFEAASHYLDLSHCKTFSKQIGDFALDAYTNKKNYISGHPSGKNDTSLFLGLAGIGYMFLKLTDFNLTTNILMPCIENNSGFSPKNFPFLSIEKENLIQMIIEKSFPKTMKALGRHSRTFELKDDTKFLERIRTLFEKQTLTNHTVRSVFQIESAQNRLLNHNPYYCAIRNLAIERKLKLIQEQNTSITAIDFFLDEGIELYQFKDDDTEVQKYILLNPYNLESPYIEINKFSFELLSSSKSRTNLDILFKQFNEIYELQENEDNFKSFLIDQIKIAIEQRLLIPQLN